MNKLKKLEKYDGSILRCRVCGRFTIEEEQDLHECRSLKSYKVMGNICLAYDGEKWYPLKWDQVRPTTFDRENFRRRLDRTWYRVLSTYRVFCLNFLTVKDRDMRN
jgi:hypothetical protein